MTGISGHVRAGGDAEAGAGLWRPRYVRSLRTGAEADVTLDEAAILELTAMLALLGSLPASVQAVAPAFGDESGAPEAVMIALAFAGGAVARLDVSMLEPEPRQEIVVVCEGRTIVLDALDARAPLRIVATGAHRGPQRCANWAETVSEHPIGAMTDRHERAASAFVSAICARDRAFGNAETVAGASLVWETARQSIAQGGEMLPLSARHPLIAPARPELRLIRGGGHGSDERAAPMLRVVGGSERPPAA
jgi:hypothetical protein